jgi:hypothetical protein
VTCQCEATLRQNTPNICQTTPNICQNKPHISTFAIAMEKADFTAVFIVLIVTICRVFLSDGGGEGKDEREGE